MKTIITLALAAVLGLLSLNSNAQEKELTPLETRIAVLYGDKETAKEDAKWSLKRSVVAINEQLEDNLITKEQAEELKKEAAENAALDLENQLAILDNKIALLKRNGTINPGYGTKVEFGIGSEDSEGTRVFGVRIDNNKPAQMKYDNRTTSSLVYAFGLNNGVSETIGIGDEFSVGQSGFQELGWAWSTRVFDDSGFLRFKYGVSLQWNKLDAKDNRYFEIDETSGDPFLATFPLDLKKSQLRTTNLVVPLHLEFGNYKKVEKENSVRYSIADKLKFGIGGYAGVRLGTQQKLKFKEDGERVKLKERRDFGGDTFVYGLSGYVGINSLSLYAKYDLNNTITTGELGDLKNVSLGLRFDL